MFLGGVGEAFLLKMLLGGVFAIGAAVIIVKILTWTRVLDWFRSRAAMKAADAANVAFAIKQAQANGKVGYIQGIFNTTTDKVVDAQQIQAEEVDQELARHHAGKDVLIIQ
jgi:hypothetical protein